jgi:hypothetical protein
MYRAILPWPNGKFRGQGTCNETVKDNSRCKGQRSALESTPHRPLLQGRTNPSVTLRCSEQAEKAGLCRALSLAILPFFLSRVYAIGKLADEESHCCFPRADSNM